MEQTLEHLAAEAPPAPDAQFLAHLELRIASFADPAVTTERQPKLQRLRARVLLTIGAVGAAAAAAVMALSPGGQPGLGIASNSLPTTTTTTTTTTIVPVTTVATADGDFVQPIVLPTTVAVTLTPVTPVVTAAVVPTTSTVVTVPPTTIVGAVASTVVQARTTSPPSSAAPTTAVPTTAVPTSAVPTSAVPTTAVPTTAVPTTAVPTPTTLTAPTTTAVRTTSSPTTLQLTCARQGPTVIACSWSTWPGNGVTYRLGRVSASSPTSQVLFEGAAPTTFTDQSLRSGETATYRVQALGADGSLLIQSNLVSVT